MLTFACCVSICQASHEGNGDEASRVSLVLALQVMTPCHGKITYQLLDSVQYVSSMHKRCEVHMKLDRRLFAQGSEHAAFLRRRALWFWLQALQMILYVVIVVLCVATPHSFSGSAGK